MSGTPTVTALGTHHFLMKVEKTETVKATPKGHFCILLQAALHPVPGVQGLAQLVFLDGWMSE